uniref:GT23 domain-containing protein n=1 Tax=Panagrolaimus sp. JU765 TaxID=591449 RepID=A0AC34PUC7_9BILA
MDMQDRVIKLPIIDGLNNRPEQLPLSFPKQISETLLKHHTNPPVYFMSQFIWYLMRNNEQMAKILKKGEDKVPFGEGKLIFKKTDEAIVVGFVVKKHRI